MVPCGVEHVSASAIGQKRTFASKGSVYGLTALLVQGVQQLRRYRTSNHPPVSPLVNTSAIRACRTSAIALKDA